VATLVGSGTGGMLTLSEQFEVLRERGPDRVSPFLIPMMIADMGSGKVSMMLGSKGPNFSTVSACSSGADAIGQGYEMIRRGEVEVAIVGGAEACICPIGLAGFSAVGALSKRNENPKAASRPFDAQRDGFVMAEGAAILVLEAEQHAMRRAAQPLAELAGYGATADAYHVTKPAPRGEGAARAMLIALKKADIQPREISHINAHGTSTPLNDKFETMAIKDVFGEEAYKIPITANKSMTGHLIGASGAVEAVVTILTLLHQTIPPTINLDHPDPECDLNYTPHLPSHGTLRYALSNSLGFGGHNSALVFRAYGD
jgi:3-oxoacyl-[acyl-carrier-protein] synthase II